MVFKAEYSLLKTNEERQKYLRPYSWTISPTDGHVTTHKFLEFINKRIKRNVFIHKKK